MDRPKRAGNPVSYSQKKSRPREKSREAGGIVIESKFSTRQDNRNVIAEGFLFSPNRQITESGNAYYRCLKRKCTVRLVVAVRDLDKLGHCQVKVRNQHNHQRRFSVDLERGYSNSEIESEIETVQGRGRDDEITTGAPGTDHNHNEIVNVNKVHSSEIVAAAKDKRNDSQNLTNDEPQNKAKLKESFLEQMMNTEILEEEEKQKFEAFAQDSFNEKDDGKIFETLKVIGSKHGRGVISSVDIHEDDYIGNFYGKLCRRLPRDSIYSFNISGGKGRKLFVDAEQENQRPILAYVNHECIHFNATVFLTGTEAGIPKLAFIANKFIPAGNEITIFYSKNYFDKKITCKCTSCDGEAEK